jgi:hypothetical protein
MQWPETYNMIVTNTNMIDPVIYFKHFRFCNCLCVPELNQASHHDSIWDVGLQLHAFLTSALDESEW